MGNPNRKHKSLGLKSKSKEKNKLKMKGYAEKAVLVLESRGTWVTRSAV